MKKGIVLTQKNFQTIYGRIRKLFNNRNYVKTRFVYTRSENTANKMLSTHTTWHPVIDSCGEVLLSKQYGKRAIVSLTGIEDPPIAIGGNVDCRDLICIGDKIFISPIGLFIETNEPARFLDGSPKAILAIRWND